MGKMKTIRPCPDPALVAGGCCVPIHETSDRREVAHPAPLFRVTRHLHRLRVNPTKSHLIQPNPTKSHQIQVDPTSTALAPFPTIEPQKTEKTARHARSPWAPLPPVNCSALYQSPASLRLSRKAPGVGPDLRAGRSGTLGPLSNILTARSEIGPYPLTSQNRGASALSRMARGTGLRVNRTQSHQIRLNPTTSGLADLHRIGPLQTERTAYRAPAPLAPFPPVNCIVLGQGAARGALRLNPTKSHQIRPDPAAGPSRAPTTGAIR